MCKLLSFAMIKKSIRQLDTHVVEDSSEYCISHDGNRDGDRQDPRFLKVKDILEYITRFLKVRIFLSTFVEYLIVL